MDIGINFYHGLAHERKGYLAPHSAITTVC